MKKNIILYFSLFLVLTSCVKTKKEYHPNGNLKSEVHYKKKERHGVANYYYTNGTQQIQSTYKNGKLNGEFKIWRFNGSLESVENYVDNVLHGESKKYYDNGQLHTIVFYNQGLLNGQYFEYHKNGQLKTEGSFDNELYDGNWFYFDMNGIPIGKANYKSGTGMHVSFHYNSSDTLVKTSYKNNLKHGDEVWYFKDGSIKEKRTYEKGALRGTKLNISTNE